ncbi:FxsA family protein [Neptunicella marina]|uniref:FxsA family protein n=1 Tax=Neptunicella marina TaxID=2125989 RepID=A0A8J6IU70_9ALTE|nr:FxsA family protein [Neptunicella marina]MBC3765701.1 FxsA family protein [Neptunicella marina]
MGKLFLLFAIMPIIEISLLVNVGEQIGGWNTVAIVILTAILGSYLVRQQGLATLFQAQTKMRSGQLPGQEMAEGLLLVIAGVLLVTPGFITDAFGLLLCLPVTRPAIAKALLSRMQIRAVYSAQQGFNQQTTQEFYSQQSSEQGDVIEGEYVDKSDTRHNLNKPD